VGFHIDGGLGDHILAARFVRDLRAASGDFRYDIYSRRMALAEWLFGGIGGLENVFLRTSDHWLFRGSYACMINAFSCPEVIYTNPAKLRDVESLGRRVKAIGAPSADLRPYIENYPFLDGYLGSYAVLQGLRRHNFSHHVAGIPYSGNVLPIRTSERVVREEGLEPRKYVTLSNGHDERMRHRTGALVTKVYPFFERLTVLLKQRLPCLRLVQVGSSNSTPIAAADLRLVNRTNLEEVAGVLAGSLLHIDGEGGLVHLAASQGTPSCVIFGPTPAAYFGYEENRNIPPKTCGGCWWMVRDWMTRCIVGSSEPPCMHTHDPGEIANAVVEEISSLRGRRLSEC
jgi:hypothetical protein